jgi:hypothetical protein
MADVAVQMAALIVGAAVIIWYGIKFFMRVTRVLEPAPPFRIADPNAPAPPYWLLLWRCGKEGPRVREGVHALARREGALASREGVPA